MSRSLGPSQNIDRSTQSHINSNFCTDVKNCCSVFTLGCLRGGFRDRRVADTVNEDGDLYPT